MKVAIISESFPPLGMGGVSSAHYNLFRLLLANSFDVKVFTFNDHPPFIEKLPLQPNVIRNGVHERTQKRILKFISTFYKIQRKLFYKTDTYLSAYQLTEIVTANLGSRRINKALKKFHPQIVILPDYGVPGFSIKRIEGATHVHICHHNSIRFIGNPFIGLHSEYDARLAVKIEKTALKKIDRIICPCTYMSKVFIETFGNILPINIIPNLIDDQFILGIKPISVHEKLEIDQSSPIIYIPSGGSSIKGERYVIEIVRRLAKKFNFKIGFYVSGGLSSIQKDELTILSEYSKLVYAPGIVNNATNIGFIKSCSVCVSPTLVENFSMAILEANFCNLPVITFDVGGNNEIIENEQNGYVVPYLDIESLIEKAIYAIERKNSFRSYDYANSKFSTNVIGQKFVNYITEKE